MASPPAALPASIVIPTRARPDYLKVALASIAPQAAALGAETIVVDDAGPTEQGRRLAERFGARYEPHGAPLGLNAARNTGVERSTGELVVFVDDDVEAREGWLDALLAGARAHPEAEVLTGPVVPRLEGRPPRTCGREGPPITSLRLGSEDRPTRYAWGANMAIRRRALERVGPFDTTLENGGDEQEWQDRLHAALEGDQPVLYLAGAALVHRRDPHDSRLRALCRAAFARGRAARRFDLWRGAAPSVLREAATLLGCAGHVMRRRCPAGLVMVAHSAGRLREAVWNGQGKARGGPSQDPHAGESGTVGGGDFHAGESDTVGGDDFLSGESGTVGGGDRLRRTLLDAVEDTRRVASGQRLRLDRAARAHPPRRRVLVLGVERPEHHRLAQAIRAELVRSRHEVELRVAAPAGRGKFENLNDLLGGRAPLGCDWLLLVDDDVALPGGFLDRFLFVCERLRLDLAQPAHALASHAAWRVTRRRRGSVARETRFVEIGPVTAFSRKTFSTLLPFPDLRMGWGLDMHWAAIAEREGWRCGVVDAVAIRHIAAPAAGAYSREQAVAEARAFLEHRPHLSAREAQRTLATHRRW
jgi:GT2 family glycosyltransferase